MDLLAWCLACSVALAMSACGSPPRSEAPHRRSEPEVPAPKPATSAWPAGLVPCAKDAPAGEGCATGPSKSGPEKSAGAAHPVDQTVWKVPVGPDDPARGPADAPVTLVVFSDFECPFCKRGAETLTRLMEAYPKDIRVVWKDLPLPMHEHAEPAAELARVARAQGGDAAFWSAHDLLYAAQPKLDDRALRAIADKLGLKWSDVRAAVRGARFGVVIRADVALSDRTDVQVTPTTFVNGRMVRGAQSYDSVRAVVDAELDKARALLAGGVSRAELYTTIMQNGRQITPPVDSPAP